MAGTIVHEFQVTKAKISFFSHELFGGDPTPQDTWPGQVVARSSRPLTHRERAPVPPDR